MFLSVESDCFDERKAFRHFQGESAATQWVKDLFIIIYSKCEKQPLLSTFLYEVVAYQLKLLWQRFKFWKYLYFFRCAIYSNAGDKTSGNAGSKNRKTSILKEKVAPVQDM
jgi:hypothetical protein